MNDDVPAGPPENEVVKPKAPMSTYSRKSKLAKGTTAISEMKLEPIGEITGMNPKQLTAFEIQQAANIIQQNKEDKDVM